MTQKITYEYVTGKFGLYTLAETKLRKHADVHNRIGYTKQAITYARTLLINMIELYEFLLEHRTLLEKEILNEQHLERLEELLAKLDPPPPGGSSFLLK